MRCQPQLLQVVDALSAAGRLAGGLNRRQEQRNQDGDDCDDDQQFNQGEASGFARRPTVLSIEVTPQKKTKTRTLGRKRS